jgi:phosphoribosyl 1,2-cyclic phosphate phosphodiesterase
MPYEHDRGPASEVECLVLGSGTSAGVPVIGCACDVCSSDDPRDRRSRPSICLRFRDAFGSERLLLVDASPDLREQALRFRLGRCDGILFTHDHFDHIFGLDDVRRFNVIMSSEIDIFAERATLESLSRIYSYIFRRESNVNPSFVASLVPREIDVAAPWNVFGIRVTPIRVFHGRMPIVGFRFDALGTDGRSVHPSVGPLPLAYLTDVSRIPDESWPLLQGLDSLILDMLRYEPHPTHFSVDEAVAAASRIAAKQTWFTHMTHEIRHRELDAELPASMRLAYDGLVLGARSGAVEA